MSNITIPLIHTDVDYAVREFILRYCDRPNVEIEARIGVFRYVPTNIPQNKVSEFIEMQEMSPKKVPLPKFSPPYLNEVVYFWDETTEKQASYYFDATVDNNSYKRIVLAFEAARDVHNGTNPDTIVFTPEYSVDTVVMLENFDTSKASFIPEEEHVILNGEHRMTEYNDGRVILIKKHKLATLDIVFPDPYDYGIRIQASEEIPFPLSSSAIETLKTLPPVTRRYKNRVSYTNNWIRFDITRVDSTSGDIRKIMNQVELEIDNPLVLKEAKTSFEEGDTETINKAVYGFWSNARMLCMAASRLLPFYEPTESANERAREILESE